MLNRRAVIIVVAALAVLFSGGAFRLPAQEPVSLTGHIQSDEEGLMEGVAVSARRAGSNMTLSVISNAKGVYSFPQNRLEAGQYSITVRAVGYDLASPRSQSRCRRNLRRRWISSFASYPIYPRSSPMPNG
jgi:hypothetical protein